jgi:hypothetical protein
VRFPTWFKRTFDVGLESRLNEEPQSATSDDGNNNLSKPLHYRVVSKRCIGSLESTRSAVRDGFLPRAAVCMVAVYRAPFIGIDKLKECLDLRPGNHALFFFFAFQRAGNLVIPASLAHEFVPHVNLVFGRPVSHGKTRLQNRSIRQAIVHVLDYQTVFSSEKDCAFFVETFSKVLLVRCGQFPSGVASNFVEQPAEIKQAAYFIVGTTKTQVSHRGVHLTNFLDLLQVIDSYSQPIARLFFFQPRSATDACENI